MVKKNLFRGRINRQNFSLNETNPIHVYLRTFQEPVTENYDMHFPLELGVILDGRMVRNYSGLHMECGLGDTWMCGIWEPHGYSVPKTPCTALVLLMQPQMIAMMHFPERPDFNPIASFKAKPQLRPRTSSSSRKEVLSIAGKIVNEATGRKDQLRLRLYTTELLLVLTENWREVSQPGNVDAGAYARLNPAIARIFENSGPVRTAEAASLCRLGRNTFSRLFQEAMGMSFSQFDLRFRLQGAADDLAKSSKPIKAIATDWGFANLSHLHRRFAENFGCSPADYRSRGTGGPQD